MSYSCTSLLTSMEPNIYIFTSTDSIGTIISSNYIQSDWKSSLVEGDMIFMQFGSTKMGVFIVHFDGSNNIFLIPNGSFTSTATSTGSFVTSTSVETITSYNGISTVHDIINWYGTATTSSGIATFYPTSDGAGSGTALFTSIHSVQATAANNTSSAIAYPFASLKAISGDNKTVTVNVGVGVALGALGGNTIANAPNGTTVYLSLIGT